MRDNSYILWESATVVAIATGFATPSANPKTGPLVQIWIIRKDRHPTEAIADGSDSAICFSCPLRKDENGRVCYVRIDPVAAIWKRYQATVRSDGFSEILKNGKTKTYTAMPYVGEGEIASLFAGKFVRFGAYGEPVLLPLELVKAIANASAGWTGYTHQWRRPWLRGYRAYFMASTTADDYVEAQKAGWRTFTVSARPLAGQMTCPASKEFELARGKRLTCADCTRCSGTAINARSVQIAPHGNGAKYAN